MSSKEEITSALNEIEIFGSLSGLMLNRNKTQGMWVGKLKNCKDKIEGIKWDNKPIKALGIYFDHAIDKCNELNWEGKINQMKKVIDILGKEESYHYRKDTNNKITNFTKIYFHS